MRFKKLELLGFKSFAEPTEFLFEPGVTAIVGPNGCGKSNCADAIKWVLGEQSARELRGGRMEDLIFNGSETREPINYAEVSLTLDNSDKTLPIEYAEVSIARRLYRSGESEYVLNGTPVRLKEIQSLLMGTGIGTSAYSLFEQGRIEQIISARPEERRVIFEEAAGITKFKSQKREALRKLEETEANLARVGDVVAEIKRQIQALERQVRRAKSYQEQFDQLKGMEIQVARRTREQLAGEWNEKEGALERLRRQMAGIEEQLGGQETRLEEERRTVAEADARLAQVREQYLSVSHQQDTFRNRLEMTRERIAEGKSRRAELAQQIAAAEDQIQQVRKNHEGRTALLAQAEDERQAKEQESSRAQERLEEFARTIAQAQQEIAQAQSRLLEGSADQSRIRSELAKILQEATRLEARYSRLEMEKGKVCSERAEVSAQTGELEQILAQIQSFLEGLSAERVRRGESLASSQAALAQLREQADRLSQERTRLSSQWELLKGLVSSHEGYSSGVKALLTALDEGRIPRDGVSGVLAEMIQIGREETAALDAALGPWAQAMVVESAAVAERCRRFLEESQAGRVLFLIRDQVPEKVPGTGLRPEPGTCAIPLIDRLGVTPHLEPMLRLILADTWLVPEGVRPLLDKRGLTPFGFSSRLVTPAGELFTGVSALLGSAPSEEGLVVGRAGRVQLLEVAVAQLENQLETARQEWAAAESDRRALEQAVQELESSFQEKIHERQRIEATLSSARTALTKLNQETQVLETEGTQVQTDLNEVRSRIGRMEEQLALKEEEVTSFQSGIEQTQERIAQATQSREETSVALARLKAEMESFDQVLESRRSSLELLAGTLEDSCRKLETGRQELTRLEESESQWESSCREMSEAIRALEEGQVQAQAQVKAAEEKKSQALTAASAQERQWLVLSRQAEQLQSQLHQKQMEQAQLKFQQEQVESRLIQVYQVNLGDLPADPLPERSDEEWEKTQGQIEELSQKLQRMGPVNLGSIEEERELQARYEHMTAQQADLTKAKEDLREAITQINRTTRAMFRETFQAIQQEFQVTFKQLFGGGEARLVLMDEEDLLESGIEIIARPPGKPVQAISLLSGGEKSLTSIALLFAIFRIKPSPFCLMDEIDAALDEPNIERFTAALKEFLKDSQFIMITHNKKTITMADCLYGITMAESGVSRIVSVKFKPASNGNGTHAVAVTANEVKEGNERKDGKEVREEERAAF